jgi:hypothetical protein
VHEESDVDDLEREIERIERGGDAWRDTDEVVQVEVARPLATFVTVRLPMSQWQEVRRTARALGVDPNALVQDWNSEKLRAVPTA